ncbi:MAG: ABC transporter ATP-binding protein [Akkermansiaceae bacterium]|nr:ABC transporter ATP-binding protein [Akkermansiaceae bacterium]
MTTGIRIHKLHRSFGKLQAVDGLSFEIPKGQVCGFIGANGAGKTTTMRILATLDTPDSGTAEIGGVNVLHDPALVRHRLGWMPDHFNVYPHMSVLEFMDFHARALGFRGKERQMRLREVMEFTDLSDILDQPAAKLSKGQTQRLCLGRALIHDPDVLILDEPAAGLDPKARVEFKHLVRILASEGKTLLISSHILSELGEMCQNLIFIHKGKLVHQGDAGTLRRRSRSTTQMLYRVECVPGSKSLAEWCSLQPDVQLIEEIEHGGRISIDGNSPEDAARMVARLVQDGLSPIEFRHEEQNLEDAFIDMMRELETEAPAATAAATPVTP